MLLVFVFSATAVLAQLQGALRDTWEVEAPPGRRVTGFLRRRLVALLLIGVLGLILLLSTALSVAVSAVTGRLPEVVPALLLRSGELAASSLTLFVVFTLVFKILPDARVRWKEAALGGLVTHRAPPRGAVARGPLSREGGGGLRLRRRGVFGRIHDVDVLLGARLPPGRGGHESGGRRAAGSRAAVKQGALTIVTPVDPERVEDLSAFLTEIGDDVARNGHVPFVDLETVHFARWVILPARESETGGAPYPAQLVYSCSHDGTAEEHLAELLGKAGPGIDRIYGHCMGFPTGDEVTPVHVAAYLLGHAVEPSIFFVGMQGLTVARVREDAGLRTVDPGASRRGRGAQRPLRRDRSGRGACIDPRPRRRRSRAHPGAGGARAGTLPLVSLGLGSCC